MDEPQVSTDDYIKAIQYAKDNGHVVNIDFDNLPDGVDPKALATAAGQGLSSAHNDALGDAADNGHTASLDYSVLGSAAKAALDAAKETGTFGLAGMDADRVTAINRSPIGQAAPAILGGIVGSRVGFPGTGAAIGEAATQGMDKMLYPDLAPHSKFESAFKIATQLAMPTAIEKGVEGVKAAYPLLAKLFTKMPMPVTKMFMDDPQLPTKYPGTEADVSKSVQAVQEGMEKIHEQASQIYADTLEKLGLSGPQTADEAAEALSKGEAKSVDGTTIGEKWKAFKLAQNLSDGEKLRRLSDINQDINAHLKWAKAGQSVDPISNKLTPTLQTLKDGVQQELTQVPGGADLQKADTVWHSFRELYNGLQPNLQDLGKAIKWMENVISDAGTGSNTAKALLGALDKAVGAPVAEVAQKQIASSLLKQPMADTMLGKMMGLMAIAHPARATTLPLVAAAQSPLAQTKGMQALMALQAQAHATPAFIAPAVAGLQQGAKAIGDNMYDADANDLVANQSR